MFSFTQYWYKTDNNNNAISLYIHIIVFFVNSPSTKIWINEFKYLHSTRVWGQRACSSTFPLIWGYY